MILIRKFGLIPESIEFSIFVYTYYTGKRLTAFCQRKHYQIFCFKFNYSTFRFLKWYHQVLIPKLFVVRGIIKIITVTEDLQRITEALVICIFT